MEMCVYLHHYLGRENAVFLYTWMGGYSLWQVTRLSLFPSIDAHSKNVGLHSPRPVCFFLNHAQLSSPGRVISILFLCNT